MKKTERGQCVYCVVSSRRVTETEGKRKERRRTKQTPTAAVLPV